MKPNILFILTDDQGAWSMGCAGNPDVKTPNMDALAERGVRFENFFCPSPVCSPARASIMTGKMPSQHGVHDWLARGYVDEAQLSDRLRAAFRDPNAPPSIDWPRSQLMDDRAIRHMAGQRMYTDMLSELGYDCALSGKWHLGDSGRAQNGFEWWHSIAMGGDNYFTPTVLMPDGQFDMLEDTYISTYITDQAIAFLDTRPDRDNPFYLSVHYTAPHAPFGRDHHPADCFEPFEDCAFESIPDVPPHPDSNFKGDMDAWRKYRTESMRGYCAALFAADREIGRLLDRLTSLGLDQNTLVIFAGDNGMNMGHHGVIGKGNGTFPMNMYEESIKVPMIARFPGHFPEGAVETGMYSHVDFFPTIAELVGGELPQGLPGRSFLKALRGEACDDGGEIVVESEYGPVRMIRTREWKYVHRYPYGAHELYYLPDDPGEVNNLAGAPEHAAQQIELKRRMEEFFFKYCDPAVDGRHEAVTGYGQIERAGIYAQGKRNYVPR